MDLRAPQQAQAPLGAQQTQQMPGQPPQQMPQQPYAGQNYQPQPPGYAQPGYAQPGYAQPAYGAYSYAHAGFWIRVAATLIDSVILLAVSLGFGAVMGAGEVFKEALNPSAPSAMPSLFDITDLFGWIIGAAYYVGMNTAFGATLGKMAVGIKIVRDGDYSPIGFGTALLRYIVESILATITCGLMYISVATNDSSRGWHDQLSGTVVIHTR